MKQNISCRRYSGISFIAALMLVGALMARPAQAADTFKIDPVHSFVLFNIKHMDVGVVWGRAMGISGTFSIDDTDASKSVVDVQVAADSIDTGNAARDKHLKGPDFFDAKQFPTISFKSKSVRKTGDNAYEVVGDFTLHGVTKPLTVTLTKIGEGDRGPQAGYRAGYGTEFTIKRSDFGMTSLLGPAGDDVKLFVNFEGTRSK